MQPDAGAQLLHSTGMDFTNLFQAVTIRTDRCRQVAENMGMKGAQPSDNRYIYSFTQLGEDIGLKGEAGADARATLCERPQPGVPPLHPVLTQTRRAIQIKPIN